VYTNVFVFFILSNVTVILIYVIIFVVTDSSADAISKTTKDTCSSRPIAICSQSSASSSGKYIRNIWIVLY